MNQSALAYPAQAGTQFTNNNNNNNNNQDNVYGAVIMT